jgi:hypothetical protein
MRIRCYSLFDITKTNVTNKKKLLDASVEEALEWQNKRSTQCNLDTIIQVISLRAQPENVTEPFLNSDDKNIDKFGFLYDFTETQNYWYFDFIVNYASVFSDGKDDLGALYNDCEDVPMIKTGKSPHNIPTSLDISPELRNIYFEILSYD